MALHEVDRIDSIRIGHISSYIREMLNEFIENDMNIAEVDIPEGSTSKKFSQYAWQIVKKEYSDKVRVSVRKDKVYFVKR